MILIILSNIYYMNNNNIIEQYGGVPLNVFQKLSILKNEYTAPYIFTRHSRSGIYYFGCVRKIYKGGRINNRGAAGTKEQYWGKWTSPGGGASKPKPGKPNRGFHYLGAVIKEINDETNSNFNTNNVDLTKLDSKYPIQKDIKMICHLVELENTIGIFLFEMHENEFFNIFPLGGNYCKMLSVKSHGEIDAIQAFSLRDILYYQNKEVLNNNNNYFTNYFLSTLTKIILPKMLLINPIITDIRPNLNMISDVNSRMATEFLHFPY
jgi:hypothetical protein